MIAGLAFGVTLPVASAQSLMTPTPIDQWQVTLGGTLTAQPAYSGASGLKPGFMPNIALSFGDKPSFQAQDDRSGLTLWHNERLGLSAIFGFDAGRYVGDSARLAGVHSVPWTIQGGVALDFWPIADRFRTRLEMVHGFRASDGFAARLSADWIEHFGALTLSGGPRIDLADRRQMNARFGVTAADSLGSIYAPYQARAGVKSVGLALSQSIKLSPSWTGTLYQHYDRLTGSAAGSPLTASRNQFSFGAGAFYTFGLGK